MVGSDCSVLFPESESNVRLHLKCQGSKIQYGKKITKEPICYDVRIETHHPCGSMVKTEFFSVQCFQDQFQVAFW